MKVMVIDCYDSFTFNLCQQIGKTGSEVIVVKNDTPFDEVKKIECDRIVLSPGSGRPEEAGICHEVLETMSKTTPTLGVCLGHQAICTSFGAEVIRADHLMHGKVSEIRHDGEGIFCGLPNPFTATRYHSLVVDRDTLPHDLQVTAVSTDDGYVMGVKHRRYPIVGVQFHPESILCRSGDLMVRNFLSEDIQGGVQ